MQTPYELFVVLVIQSLRMYDQRTGDRLTSSLSPSPNLYSNGHTTSLQSRCFGILVPLDDGFTWGGWRTRYASGRFVLILSDFSECNPAFTIPRILELEGLYDKMVLKISARGLKESCSVEPFRRRSRYSLDIRSGFHLLSLVSQPSSVRRCLIALNSGGTGYMSHKYESGVITTRPMSSRTIFLASDSAAPR